MAKFHIGIPTSLYQEDGSANFPAYVLKNLVSDPRVEISHFKSEPTLRAETIAGYDCIVLFSEKLVGQSFSTDGHLVHVAKMGVGYDTVDIAACTANDVVITITPDAVRRPMAVATLCYMLALTSNLFVKDQMSRRGPEGWSERIHHHGMGLTGRTLGIVGLGNIGSEIAEITKPLDMELIANDPYVSSEKASNLGVTLVDLDDVFRTADIISLNCPLTDETRHLVDSKRLALMKTTSYLINTARGPVVDQAALYHALKNKRIAGAGLDVQDPEPSGTDEDLNSLDNVVLAPHALGWTDEMFANMARINESDIRSILLGNTPENAVNRDVFGRPGFQEKLRRRAGS